MDASRRAVPVEAILAAYGMIDSGEVGVALVDGADHSGIYQADVAAPRLIERILRQLTAEEAEIIRHRLDHPGPTRLRDVEEARRQLAELARRLVTAGRCQMPAVNHRRSLMSVA